MSSNVDKIYAEYPFLGRLFPRLGIKTASVKRWGEDFFSTSPVTWYDSRYTATFLLLDANGEVITRIGKSWIPFWVRDENAGQALARIGSREARVRYAVHVSEERLILFKR